MEVYKLIQEASTLLKGDEIECFIDKFISIPPDQFVEKEVQCVYDLTKYMFKNQSNS